ILLGIGSIFILFNLFLMDFIGIYFKERDKSKNYYRIILYAFVALMAGFGIYFIYDSDGKQPFVKNIEKQLNTKVDSIMEKKKEKFENFIEETKNNTDKLENRIDNL